MKILFDHEKLDVYQLELKFIAWVTVLIDDVRQNAGPKATEIIDHLDRASLSSLLNTAEGNGKRQRQIRGRYFDDARGSGTECAACLDALVAKCVCDASRVQEGKEMLFRIVSMLSKMVAMFSGENTMREEGVEYRVTENKNRGRGRGRRRRRGR
jgi:four helix bundle protein